MIGARGGSYKPSSITRRIAEIQSVLRMPKDRLPMTYYVNSKIMGL